MRWHMPATTRIDSPLSPTSFRSSAPDQNRPRKDVARAVPALGKHKFIINHTSALMARELGNAQVAPVVIYVQEGDVNNPTRGHLAKAGTVTFPWRPRRHRRHVSTPRV